MSEALPCLDDIKPWLEYDLVLEGQELARDLKHKAATLLCHERIHEDLQAEELVNKFHKEILSSSSELESLEWCVKERNAPIVKDGKPVEATPALPYNDHQKSQDEHLIYETHMKLLLSMNEKIHDFQSVLSPPHVAFASLRAAHESCKSKIKYLEGRLIASTKAQQLESKKYVEHVSRLESEWAAQKSEMQKRNERELSTHERKASALQIQLAEAQNLQNYLQTQQKNLESKLADAERERDGYQTKYENVSGELSSLRVQHIDELGTKRMELEEKQKKMEQARKSHKDLWNYYSTTKGESEARVAGLEASLALQKTSLEAIKEEIAQKVLRTQGLVRDSKVNNQCIDGLHRLVFETERNCEAALLDQDRSHQKTTRRIIDETKKTSKCLEEGIKSTKAMLEAAQLKEKELPGLKSRVEFLEARLKETEGDRDCFKVKAENRLKLANAAEKKLEEAKQANVQLASKCQVSEAAITDMNQQFSQFAAAFRGPGNDVCSDTPTQSQETCPQSQSMAGQGVKRGRSEMESSGGASNTKPPRTPGAKRAPLSPDLNRPATPPAQEPETPKPFGRHTVVKAHHRRLKIKG